MTFTNAPLNKFQVGLPHLNCCQPSDCKGSKISSLQINNLDYELLSDGRKLSYYEVLIFVYNVDEL